MNIFINGAGTVGTSIARLLASMPGMEVSFGKRSVRPDDPKTYRLLQVMKDFGNKPLYLSNESAKDFETLDDRIDAARKLGFHVAGSIEPDDMYMGVPFHRLDAVLDCTDGEATGDYVERIYRFLQAPFLLQGGADPLLAEGDFLSAPHATSWNQSGQNQSGQNQPGYGQLRRKRQLSCNGSTIGALLGVLFNALDPSELSSATVHLRRRSKDPEDNRRPIYDTTPPVMETHHQKDLEQMYPLLEGRIQVSANKNPWQHYHRFEVVAHFRQPLSMDKQALTLDELRKFQRGIYLDQDPGGESNEEVLAGIRTLCSTFEAMGIPDGDCLFPVYSASFVAPIALHIAGFTPQRSVVASSSADWLLAATGKVPLVSDAFAYTNAHASWYGYPLLDLKREAETNLTSVLNSILSHRKTRQVFTQRAETGHTDCTDHTNQLRNTGQPGNPDQSGDTSQSVQPFYAGG